MQHQHVESTLHGLVQYIFIDNTDDAKVYMNLPHGEHGIRDNHDMFVFCIDLLCKGLVVLYGDTPYSVCLESLSMNQIDFVKKKMANAGLLLKLDTSHVESETFLMNRPRIVKIDDDDKLTSYRMHITSSDIEYTIHFDFIRI
jgi:hypothetical protein